MKKLILFLLTAMLLVGCGQTNQAQEAVYMNITAEEAKQIMDSEEGYIILDTRTQAEYDEIRVSTQEYFEYKEEYQRQERENDKLM